MMRKRANQYAEQKPKSLFWMFGAMTAICVVIALAFAFSAPTWAMFVGVFLAFAAYGYFFERRSRRHTSTSDDEQ